MKILQSENIPSVRAWFGASLSYESKAFLSDYDGSSIVPNDNLIETSYILTLIAAGEDVGKLSYFSLYDDRDASKSQFLTKCKKKFLGLMIFSKLLPY